MKFVRKKEVGWGDSVKIWVERRELVKEGKRL
jgi:hypothetical protein